MAKKIISFTLLVILIWWLWTPGGDPSDVLTFAIIASIGMRAYILWTIIITVIAYNLIDGNGIKGKWQTVKNELKKFMR